MDGSGNLYGTSYGGASKVGTIFELAKGSGTITTLASFNGTNGSDPEAGLVMDSSGNLYGTTRDGGASNDGTVFELAKDSSTITTLTTFNGTNGAYPEASLLMDSSGNLYGTTDSGGPANYGTVFELQNQPTVDQWTGANFAVDTNWSDGANWSLGAAPTAGQTALFTKNASVKHFTATVDSGFTSAIAGLDVDSTWGGTILVKNALSVTGNLTLASGTVRGSGVLTIAGTASQWTGGQIDLGSGGFHNSGTLTIDTTGGNLVLRGPGTLTNQGTINEIGTNALLLENNATLRNAGGATFDLTDNGSVSQSGGGTLINGGTLEKTGGTGTSTLSTSTLNNTGTVEVASGTLDIAAAVAQIASNTLTAGSWTVMGSAKVPATLDITSASFTTLGSAAKVRLNGLDTAFTNLSGLTTIDAGGSLTLAGHQSFTTAGALTDNGSLTLGPASILTVSGSFTEGSTGTLTLQMGLVSGSPAVGSIVSTTGTVALGGSLTVTSTTVPAVGSSFALVDNEGDSAIDGTFTGLAEGATFTVKDGGTTMTFQISYMGTDSDGSDNVDITRIS
jgi:uncharacterized repeat protein (TIGR03803 family)